MPLAVRLARETDLTAIDAIYAPYVRETAITFDVEVPSPESRREWFRSFAAAGPHRLWVAESEGEVKGWACSRPFRPKAAYETTVETTVYVRRGAQRAGVGSALYRELFRALAGEDLQLAVAGITLPNEASEALHRRFHFTPVGTFEGVGRKLGRLWDVRWYQRPLRPPGSGS